MFSVGCKGGLLAACVAVCLVLLVALGLLGFGYGLRVAGLLLVVYCGYCLVSLV